MYAISFFAVNGATTVFELSQADIFFTIIYSRKSQETCGFGPGNATMQQFAARGGVGSQFSVEDAVHDTIATVTTRRDCTSRDRNEI